MAFRGFRGFRGFRVQGLWGFGNLGFRIQGFMVPISESPWVVLMIVCTCIYIYIHVYMYVYMPVGKK